MRRNVGSKVGGRGGKMKWFAPRKPKPTSECQNLFNAERESVASPKRRCYIWGSSECQTVTTRHRNERLEPLGSGLSHLTGPSQEFLASRSSPKLPQPRLRS